MTIAGMKNGGKAAFGRIPADYLIILILLLTASAAFALGILLGREMGGEGEGDRFWIEELGAAQPALPAASAAAPVPERVQTPAPVEEKRYVASKNGARYYLPECSGVKRIKEENKVWFASKEFAEAEGYTPAVNCSGL